MATKIWDATDRVTLRSTDKLPLDVSSGGSPRSIEAVNFLPELKHSQRNYKLATAMAGYHAGLNDVRILCVGDSTTFGRYSNGSTTGEFKAGSYPTLLTEMLNNAGFNAHANSFFGYGNGTTTNIANDARINVTGTLTQTPAITIGGGAIVASSGEGLDFTPTENVDTFKIYMASYTQNRVYSHEIDSEGASTVDTQGAETAAIAPTVTTTTSLGAHTLHLDYSSGSDIAILGIEAYDSSKKWIHVMNAGIGGAEASDWNDSTYGMSPQNSWTAYAPDVIFLSLGINDWNGGTSVATYKTNMQALITQMLSDGIDVVLISPATFNFPDHTDQVDYVEAMRELADSNDLTFIDNHTRFGTNAQSLAANLYDGVDAHPLKKGHAHFAAGILPFLKNI